MTQIDEWLKKAGDFNDKEMPDEAMEMATRVLTLEPDNHKALFVIGSVLVKIGRGSQAQQYLRRVASLKPNAHQSWGNLSIASAEMHRYEEAITFAERAIRCKKDSPPDPRPEIDSSDWARVYADAGFAHSTAGNWHIARSYCDRALKMDPEFRDAIFHLANVDLAEQRWSQGWAGFKVSEGGKWRKKYSYDGTKEWEGERDAVVMVTGEQGLGDEVLMAGLIPDASKLCQKFIFDCDARMAALFARSFPEVIVTPTRQRNSVALPIAPTHHRSLFGLAQLLRTKNADFPRQPYLKASPEYRRMFRALFDSYTGKRIIGISWSGGFPRTGQVERTAGVSAFLPLIRGEPDAVFVSLQYKDDAAEIASFAEKAGCQVVRVPWAAQGQDIDILAAMLAECDEVIGVATAALHLSSALGVPTTWLCNRGLNWVFAPDELLWYPPTARIWRKDRGESWRDCIGQLTRQRREQRQEAA